jgi:hypothetical protein
LNKEEKKLLGYAREIVEAITDYGRYDGEDGKELVSNMLLYLFNNTTDKKLKKEILGWFTEEKYCIECGAKLLPYEYSEPHTELDHDIYEYHTVYLCPFCDKDDIVS